MIIDISYVSNRQGYDIKTSIDNKNRKFHVKCTQYLLFSETNH